MQENVPDERDAVDDLPPEAVAAARKRSQIKALLLAVIMMLAVVVPAPWKGYTPLLVVLPLLYLVMTRVRGKAAAAEPPSRTEPFSEAPKDPKDPRRYRPIT